MVRWCLVFLIVELCICVKEIVRLFGRCFNSFMCWVSDWIFIVVSNCRIFCENLCWLIVCSWLVVLWSMMVWLGRFWGLGILDSCFWMFLVNWMLLFSNRMLNMIDCVLKFWMLFIVLKVCGKKILIRYWRFWIEWLLMWKVLIWMRI